jgi:HK97 family phage major capsid protein
MTLKDIEMRASEIREAMKAEDADIEALKVETKSLVEEKARLMAETAEKEAEVEERKADMEAVIESKGIEIEKPIIEEKMTMTEVRNSKEYIDGYANYIKTGDDSECRALLTENGGGAVPVPEMVYDIVKNAWEKEGIMSLVKKSYLKGNLKVGFELSAGAATVHTEGQAVNEESLTLGICELTPIAIKKWVSISDEALDLTGETFLRYIYDEVAYQIAKKAADEIVAKIEACGTVATTNAVGVPKVTAATVGIGTVAQAMAQLSDQAANPVVMMNKQTWGAFKAAQAAASYAYDPFEGLPVVFNNTIKAFSAASTGDTYAIVGDLGEGALANFPNGGDIKFKFDDLSLATSDLVRVIGRQHVGLGIIGPNAFVKVVK